MPSWVSRVAKWKCSRGWWTRTWRHNLCYVHTPWVGRTLNWGNRYPITAVSPGGAEGWGKPTPWGHGVSPILRFQRCLLQRSLWQTPTMEGMGSCNRPHTWDWTPSLLDIPPVPCRTEGAWQLPPWKPHEWLHPSIQISYGGSSLRRRTDHSALSNWSQRQFQLYGQTAPSWVHLQELELHPLCYPPHSIWARLRPTPTEFHCRSHWWLCPANVSNECKKRWKLPLSMQCEWDGTILWLSEEPHTCLWSWS